MFPLGVTLRPATLDDREQIHAWMTAPGVVESMLGPPLFPDCAVPSFQEFKADWLPHFFTHSEPELGRMFVIVRGERDVGAIAHNATVSTAAGQRGTELDLWLASAEQRGRGYGPAALALLCARLEDELDLEVAFLQPSARNPAAIRAYFDAGFRRVELPAEAAAAHFSVVPDAHDAVFLQRQLQGQVRLTRLPSDFNRESALPALQLADDSRPALLSYYQRGSLYALFGAGAEPVVTGHVLLAPGEAQDSVELLNLAVVKSERQRGHGSAMLRELLARLARRGVRQVRLATATADSSVLHFYQRLGFRFRSIERDAFTQARGYPPNLSVRGVPVLDRVWLDREIDPAE
jgi:RimJ/RimL family protein N-acetyltransferase